MKWKFEDESLCHVGHTSGQQTSPSSGSAKGAQDASGLKTAYDHVEGIMKIADEDWKKKLPKTPLDKRTRRAKERSDHFIAENIEKNEREEDPRLEKEPIKKDGDEEDGFGTRPKTSPILTHQPLAAEEGMEVEEVQMSEANDDDDVFAEKANPKTESRVKTPERRPPVKRRAGEVRRQNEGQVAGHEDEPGFKMKIIDDDEMDDGGENLDIGIMKSKQQDKEIIYHAMLGHDLTEVYGSERLELTANREFLRQIMSTDVSEVFSPERVTTVCEQYGLVPGEAMDIKNGYDFDLVSDQKKGMGFNYQG